MAKEKSIQARVTDRFMARVELIAAYEGLNKADLVTIAVKEYLEKAEERMRQDHNWTENPSG